MKKMFICIFSTGLYKKGSGLVLKCDTKFAGVTIGV